MDLSITKLGPAEKVPMDLLLASDPSEEMIRKYLYAGDCYLARLQEELVGVFVIMPNTANEIELKNISVAEAHQRKGIGEEIIKYVIRISKLEGYQYLIVKTADVSTDTIQFYRRMKFQDYFVVKATLSSITNIPLSKMGSKPSISWFLEESYNLSYFYHHPGFLLIYLYYSGIS